MHVDIDELYRHLIEPWEALGAEDTISVCQARNAISAQVSKLPLFTRIDDTPIAEPPDVPEAEDVAEPSTTNETTTELPAEGEQPATPAPAFAPATPPTEEPGSPGA